MSSAGHSRGRRQDSPDHCLGAPDCHADQGSAPISGEGRAALHNLDTRGRSQHRVGELSWESCGAARSLGASERSCCVVKLSFECQFTEVSSQPAPETLNLRPTRELAKNVPLPLKWGSCCAKRIAIDEAIERHGGARASA
jgi:hypothetical protein